MKYKIGKQEWGTVMYSFFDKEKENSCMNCALADYRRDMVAWCNCHKQIIIKTYMTCCREYQDARKEN